MDIDKDKKPRKKRDKSWYDGIAEQYLKNEPFKTDSYGVEFGSNDVYKNGPLYKEIGPDNNEHYYRNTTKGPQYTFKNKEDARRFVYLKNRAIKGEYYQGFHDAMNDYGVKTNPFLPYHINSDLDVAAGFNHKQSLNDEERANKFLKRKIKRGKAIEFVNRPKYDSPYNIDLKL